MEEINGEMVKDIRLEKEKILFTVGEEDGECWYEANYQSQSYA